LSDNGKPDVCLTVDYDALSIWMMMDATGARSISRGEFAVTDATPRLLEVFERHEIETTWFIPGITAAQFPESCSAVAAAGHEIANHGHLHEDFGTLPLDEARIALSKANEVLEQVTGKRPTGSRLSGNDLDLGCMDLVAELGFDYDSSLFGGYRAVWARSRDTWGDDGMLTFGEPLDLVELPIGSYNVTDFSHFEISAVHGLPVALANPRHLEEVWVDELDDLDRREPDGFLMLAIHPQTIGRGSRLAMLERVIEYAKNGGHRFVTCEYLARNFRESQVAAPAV
jgi:peptidoglycan/xylan/chitin deacetylase (PgdA/CDA1 family)